MSEEDAHVDVEAFVGHGAYSHLATRRVAVRIPAATAFAALGAARIVRDLADPAIEVAVSGELDVAIEGDADRTLAALRAVRTFRKLATARTTEDGRVEIDVGLFASPTERVFATLGAGDFEKALVAAGLLDEADRSFD